MRWYPKMLTIAEVRYRNTGWTRDGPVPSVQEQPEVDILGQRVQIQIVRWTYTVLQRQQGAKNTTPRAAHRVFTTTEKVTRKPRACRSQPKIGSLDCRRERATRSMLERSLKHIVAIR